DGILMLRVYDWAFVTPIRKLYYNLTITFLSVAVAVLVGGIETLGLLGDRFALKGVLWDRVGALNDNFTALGVAIIGLFIAAWAGSVIVYRFRALDEIHVRPGDR
ncbi:MAG: HoxN/HupN/NixA family nickel/cobalt transporter, partial [Alphaproteobacteria bacterium]|nr:HoxN/HupN/NixA family nickel/cobalt transporter [Alphaproteobacteria bacterium]